MFVQRNRTDTLDSISALKITTKEKRQSNLRITGSFSKEENKSDSVSLKYLKSKTIN